MAHRRENQEKLALQAKLKNSFSNINSTVLGWLGDDGKSNGGQEELNRSKKEFFALPLVATGTGLSFNETKHSTDINTVGEFVESDKKVKTLGNKKRRQQNKAESNNNNLYKVSKDDTKAMLALKRRMRKSKVGEMRQDPSIVTGKLEQKKQPVAPQDSESEEDEPKVEKTKKKSFGLLFANKKNKKRK